MNHIYNRGIKLNNKEINRLEFENILWLIFAIVCLLNIVGDYEEEIYIKNNDYKYKNKANKVFELTLSVTFLIYVYFAIRNYNALNKASDEMKSLYEIKLLGSIFLIAGVVCLLYFQFNQKNFIGSPAL